MKTTYMKWLPALTLALAGCDALDLEPESSISDNNYWRTADQYQAAYVGCMSWFRGYQSSYFTLGELRANTFNGTPFGGEATQGMENLWNNTLSSEQSGVSNYGGMYYAINQLNLLIAKTNENSGLGPAARGKYLGAAHGMRAFLYFQMLRSWGDVIVYTDYTQGSNVDIGNMARSQDPAAAVMAQIKSDIAASESAYDGNWAFSDGKTYWSLSATKMLKGEVFLWSGAQMGGGDADLNTAKTALQEVMDNSGCSLLADYGRIFRHDNKGNAEIIFALRNAENETALWGGTYAQMLPQQNNTGANRYTEDGRLIRETTDYEFNAVMRIPLGRDLYQKLYADNDPRKRANLRGIYQKGDDETLTYEACYAYKFQGTLLSGQAQRSMLDDAPIYRYADCLLLMAEAKALLGESPKGEIDQVRRRAYGDAWDEAALGYPNDNDATLYADNQYVAADNAGAAEAVAKERLRELIFEGKRWYDIRLLNLATKYSLATADRLLWPVNQSAMTDNSGLRQTPGY